MATEQADPRSAPLQPWIGATPLACVAYAACLLCGALALGSPPVSWIALPVLIGAVRDGMRAALWVSLGLGLLTLAVYLTFGPRGDPAATLTPWLLGVPLLGAALGRARDLRQRDIDRAERGAERHALAARSSGDGMFEWDLESGRVLYDDGIATLLGCTRDALAPAIDTWFARVHHDDLPGLRAALDAHLDGATQQLAVEHRLRRDDGAWLWAHARAKAAHDARGRPLRLAGWIGDIHARKQSDDRLQQHAFHDPLTGLPNRALFLDRLAHAVARSHRSAHEHFALMRIDLDRSEPRDGPERDALQAAVGARLAACLRPGDTVARCGDAQFALLLEGVRDGAGARRVAERVQRALALPVELAGRDVAASASIGLALGDGSSTSAAQLSHEAEAALQEACARGRGQLASHSPRTHDRARERAELERVLRSAIDRGELSVAYQPIVALADGRIVGFEALARLRHPSLGNVAPLRFIPLAEEAGLIAEIGAWVLAQATSEAARLHRACPEAGPLRMHVNVSARQLQEDSAFAARVERAMADNGLGPGQLTIELDEAVVMEDLERNPPLLGALRARGVQLCLDDFGTGYASLSALHRFPVDSLKIDLSFVRELTEPGGRGELVHTILTLARALGIDAVAEGIETPAQRARLLALGCAHGQGFLFSPPVDPATVEALLRTPPRWVA